MKLSLKNKVLFNILCRADERCIQKSIDSCLNQSDIIPYINVSILSNADNSFSKAKEKCVNPIIYEPNIIYSENTLISRGVNEQNSIIQSIQFGAKNSCKYYCFMHSPCVLNPELLKKSIKLIKDDVVGCYSNIIDSDIRIYTSFWSENSVGIGPVVILKDSVAQRFNAQNMGDFIKSMVNFGVLYHIPEFLVEAQWINSISKQ